LIVDFALARELFAVVVLVFFETGLDFLVLVFDFFAFVAFVNVFVLPFDAFFGVIFDREGAFFAPFDFGLNLVPALAFFLGLALVDEER
jgi:hypothetical protein